jgi:hypothetical protein
MDSMSRTTLILAAALLAAAPAAHGQSGSGGAAARPVDECGAPTGRRARRNAEPAAAAARQAPHLLGVRLDSVGSAAGSGSTADATGSAASSASPGSQGTASAAAASGSTAAAAGSAPSATAAAGQGMAGTATSFTTGVGQGTASATSAIGSAAVAGGAGSATSTAGARHGTASSTSAGGSAAAAGGAGTASSSTAGAGQGMDSSTSGSGSAISPGGAAGTAASANSAPGQTMVSSTSASGSPAASAGTPASSMSGGGPGTDVASAAAGSGGSASVTDTATDPRAAARNRAALRLGLGPLGDRVRLGPAASVSVPTALGVDAGEMFFGAAYQGRTRYTDEDDAAAVVGLGLGTRRVVALEMALTTYSTFRSAPFETGGLSLKLHRSLGGQTSVAVGWENALLWGGSDDDGSVYAVASRLVNLRDNPAAPFSTGVVTLGVGNGRFRFEEDDAEGRETANVFGAVGVRVAAPLSVVADWTGQDLNAAASITPAPRLPLVVTVGLADITGSAGDGARLIFSLGYGLAFPLPF